MPLFESNTLVCLKIICLLLNYSVHPKIVVAFGDLGKLFSAIAK